MHHNAATGGDASSTSAAYRPLSIDLPKPVTLSQLETDGDDDDDRTPKADSPPSGRKSASTSRFRRFWHPSGAVKTVDLVDAAATAKPESAAHDSPAVLVKKRFERGSSGLSSKSSSDTLSAESRSFAPSIRAKSSFLKRLWTQGPPPPSTSVRSHEYRRKSHTGSRPPTPPAPSLPLPPTPPIPPQFRREKKARQRHRYGSLSEQRLAGIDRHRRASSGDYPSTSWRSLEKQSHFQVKQDRHSTSIATRRGQPRPIISSGLYKQSSSASIGGYDGSDNSSLSRALPNQLYGSPEQQSFSGQLTPVSINGSISSFKRAPRTQRSQSSLPIIESSPPTELAKPAQAQRLESRRRDTGKCNTGAGRLQAPGSQYAHRKSGTRRSGGSYASKEDEEDSVRGQGYAKEEEEEGSKRSSPSIISSMVGGEKGSSGGWRNPFSTGKKKAEEATSGGKLRHETSADSLTIRGRSSKIRPEDEREWAAQQIAQQQRAANDARLASLIPALESSSTSKARMSKREEILADRNKLSSFGAYADGAGADKHYSQTAANFRNLEDKDEGEEASCPVCLELLSFRLAGEKPHVVPTCGHALHHACFTAVYGPPENVLAAQEMTANGGAGSGRPMGPPGMCGICRKPIVLGGENASGKPNKAAGMMGVGEKPDRRSPIKARAERDDPLEAKRRERSRDRLTTPSSPMPSLGTHQNEHSASHEDPSSSPSRHLVTPQIRMRPEYDTLYRKDRTGENGKQNTVCVISIDVPPRRPQPSTEQEELSWYSRFGAIAYEPLEQDLGPDRSPQPEAKEYRADDVPPETQENHRRGQSPEENGERRQEQPRSSEPRNADDDDDDDEEEAFSFSATPARPQDAFASVVRDLSMRIQDWKGHSADKFGPLLLFDYIGVRQEPVMRDFYVYLFKEALLCVVEDRKNQRGIARLIGSEKGPSHGPGANEHSGGAGFGNAGSNEKKTALKLKGRIWIRHIKACRDALSNPEGQYGLSIKLDDENLDHFVLCFKDPAMREKWRAKFLELLEDVHSNGAKTPAPSAITDASNASNVKRTWTELASPAMAQSGDEVEDPIKSAGTTTVGRRARLGSNHSGKTGSTDKINTSPTVVDYSPQTNHANATSTAAPNTPSTHSSATAATANCVSGAAASSATGRPFRKVLSEPASHQQWASSGGLDPKLPLPEMLPHAPLDLVIMFSIPTVASSTSTPSLSSTTLSSSAALKLRLLKSTLEFVIANLGPRDRLALVAYQVGPQGPVRRTGMLNSSKERSREKLENFVATIGKTFDSDEEDPFREDLEKLGGSSDRTDTVTAVNVGLDIVLQRKGKNPVTGMILINDTADQPRRGQMDLIMARAEAANVPVHCFGFGKGHDPSSLWLISNHTKGTYTFVEQWFWLRESIAGCVGSLMSVAATDAKIHISVPGDNHFKVRKVSGTSASILAQSGKDVDVELGELRFGECKELFVELEFDFNGLAPMSSVRNKAARSSLAYKSLYEQGSATDDFFQRLGLQGLSLTDGGGGADQVGSYRKGDLADGGQPESFIEEVAVLEVDCGYRDPALGTTVKKLSHPSVLTVEVDSVSQDPINDSSINPTALADPVVTRRRLEILTSDMITRSLLLVSRKHYSQALTILAETRRIVDTVLEAVPIPVAPQSSSALANSTSAMSLQYHNGSTSLRRRESQTPSVSSQKQNQYHQATKSTAKKQREALHRRTAESLFAILEDLDVLIDGLEGSRSTFERSQRNFGAQQAMALRDQKAWTSRTDTEWAFHRRIDNGPAFAARGDAFAAGLT